MILASLRAPKVTNNAYQCWSVLMLYSSMQFAYLYTWNREIIVNSQKLVKRRWFNWISPRERAKILRVTTLTLYCHTTKITRNSATIWHPNITIYNIYCCSFFKSYQRFVNQPLLSATRFNNTIKFNDYGCCMLWRYVPNDLIYFFFFIFRFSYNIFFTSIQNQINSTYMF